MTDLRSESNGHSFECPPYSLFEGLMQTVGKYPERPAMYFYQNTMPFAMLAKAVTQVSAFLYAQGVRKGDRVGIMLPNCPHYVIAFYACMRIGAVVVQINPMYVPREVAYTLQDADAKALVVLDRLYAKLAPTDDVRALAATLVVSLGGEADLDPTSNASAWDDVMQTPYPIPEPAGIVPEEDLAVLQYTGGTTGRSKGVMLTHRNLVANAWQSIQVLGEDSYRPEDKILLASPLFHVYGMSVGMNVAILVGCAMVLVPRFQTEEVLQLIKAYQPRYFPGVPTMYVAIASHPDAKEYGVDAIQICNSGSAPLPYEVQKRFEDVTGGKILEGYGLSEASPVTHTNRPDGSRRSGSIGLPMPGTDVKIVDLGEGRETVAVGELGELVVRGPQVMKGYWNLPVETQEAIRDGWLYTGDIARMDEDGYYYIVDRKKDMIISSGFNIYPRDIEEVLYQHPAVQEAVVVGVPDEYRGETVKALLVLKPDVSAEGIEETLNAFCREHLAPYKVPRLYEVRTELPKTAVGKILRRALKTSAGALA